MKEILWWTAFAGATALLLILGAWTFGELVRTRQDQIDCRAACRPNVSLVIEDSCVCAQTGGIWAPPAVPLEKS